MTQRAALALVLLAGTTLVSGQSTPLFIDAARSTGLVFMHENGAGGRHYLPEIMGSGAALLDYDNDGDLDVFLVQGGPTGTAPATGPATSARPISRLFRNDRAGGPGGQAVLRFTDVTAPAGIQLASQGMGAAVGDYNNDGFQDLFVTTFGPDFLFRNNGNGTFTDVAREAGVSDDLWSTSAAFLDYDRDGDLDLFVANYVAFTIANHRQCRDGAGAPDYCTPSVYAAVPDRLYRNDGQGRFTNVTELAGIGKAFGKGLGVVTGDFDGDGWIDVYVANDATPNQLWINRRNGTFVDRGLLSGAAFNAAGFPEASMGIAAGDFDADGDEDLFITNLVQETFVLYVNDGRGLFEDARSRTGIGPRTGAYTGFGTDWFDYDNDGWLDLLIANGAVNIIPKLRGQTRPYRMNAQLFRNTGAGRLEEVPPAAAGPSFSVPEVGRGAAFGDLDNDGDIDVVVSNNAGPTQLLLNESGRRAAWVQVRLDHGPRNRLGIGSWVGVHRPGRPTLWRRVKTDGSYLSASDSRVHFGLGTAPAISAIEVHWPDGSRERFAGIDAGRLATLKRGAGTPVPASR
jgi:hypothetical protein